MKTVRLNGNRMATQELAHEYLKWKLELPDYYGKNLDALWDILSSYSDPLEIHLYNHDNLIKQLGQYGDAIVELLQDIVEEKDNIIFLIEDKEM